MNMPTETFLTTVYTIIDDWYQPYAPNLLAGKAGKKPLFPRLLHQSQFNRRARALCWLLRELCRHLIAEKGLVKTPCQLIDGTPVQVRHWRRLGKGHLLWPEASLGYCAAKKETYYGFRLLAVTTLDGIIVDWNLFAANADERVGPQECWKVTAASAFWATRAFRRQQGQNPRVWDTAMNRAWRVIETTFAQAKGAFGLEKPGARSLWGLQSRLIAKIIGLTLAACHNVQQGHSPLRLTGFSF